MARTYREAREELNRLSDEDLARQSSNDHVALNVLLERIRPDLFAFARSMGMQEDDAEDLVQKALVRIARHVHRYDPRRGARLRTWTRTILFRLALNENRAKQRHRRAVERFSQEYGDRSAGSWMHPEVQLMERQMTNRIDAALRELPDEFQQVLRLSIEGLSDAEIAVRCGLRSEGTVKSRKHRARARMRLALAGVM